MKCVIGGELFDPGKSSDIDRNVQRIHVTIRPLNREDSVLYFPPEAFGPFRVLHQIGAGALGPVFRAYEPADAADERRDRLVAVKVFRLDLTPDQSADLVEQLQVLIDAHINHPNIAAPIAAGLDHGAAYLAQEYAVGDSLDIVLRERGVMPGRDVAALVQPLAAAIDYAAERGVHHGLLHLRDIVLSADAARITGFGLAGALSKVGGKLPARPQYAAPTSASDVYSLGAIAFEAATGKRCSAENLDEFEEQHGSELRNAFAVPLASNAASATDYAQRLLNAVGAKSAVRATGNKPAPRIAAVGPIAPVEAVASIPIPDPLDRVIDLGASHTFELDAPVLVERAEPPSPPAPVVPSWLAPASRVIDPAGIELEPVRRVWPIAVMFVVVAMISALGVGWYLRSRGAGAETEKQPGVDSTVVDLPAAAPAVPAEPAEPIAPDAPIKAVAPPAAPGPSPAPTPSRPASGAVERTQTGSMLIRSTPADADVVVNGKPRGKTPLALRDLALGSYTIRVARDGYAIEERTLQLTARRPTSSATLNLRAEKTGPGGLNVQSRPAGARVFVNDRPAGTTPIAIPGLTAGSITVRIELDGYLPWTTTVRVGSGGQTRVAASLERK